MSKLNDFLVTERWPAQNPDILQLYSLNTPNGIKVAVMLEEIGLPYEPHLVDISKNDQMTPAFLSVAPNNKIPAILDPNGPDGHALPLFESGAILIYLAEKSGQFFPQAKRYEILQWLMFQMGGLGPMFGQFGFFHVYGGKEIEDERPRERYRAEAARLLTVLEKALEGRDWIAGDYSIADMAIAPWLRTMREGYKGAHLVGWEGLKNVPAYLERFLARPAVQRAIPVTSR